MSAIFESVSLGPTERLIMLALADHADDDGRCYPSVARIAQRTGLSERAVQTNVRSLIAAGYINITIGGGKGNSNLYFISANPAADAPQTPQEMHPAADAPRTICTPNPAADAPNPAADAPEPSITTKEPSEEKVTRFPAPDLKPCLDHFNAVAARVGWPQVQMFNADRRTALSQRISDTGGQAEWCEAIDRAARSPLLTGNNDRGWKADFDWLAKPKNFTKLMEGNYDPRNSNPSFGTSTGRGNRPDPALEQIARLTGLSAASGDDRVRVGGFGEKDGPLWMGTRPQ